MDNGKTVAFATVLVLAAATCYAQPDTREMKPGEAVHITPPTVHRMTAIGNQRPINWCRVANGDEAFHLSGDIDRSI